mgnify:FL=1
MCDVRDTTVRFALTPEEKRKTVAMRTRIQESINVRDNSFANLEYDEEGGDLTLASDWSKVNFFERLQTAAAQRCRVYDVGGEYTYQHLVPHLPLFNAGTVVVVCVSTKGALGNEYHDVQQHLLYWIDAILARRDTAVSDLDVTFVGTSGLGTFAELHRFRLEVKVALQESGLINIRFHVAMLVMLADQRCFMQHYDRLPQPGPEFAEALKSFQQLALGVHDASAKEMLAAAAKLEAFLMLPGFPVEPLTTDAAAIPSEENEARRVASDTDAILRALATVLCSSRASASQSTDAEQLTRSAEKLIATFVDVSGQRQKLLWHLQRLTFQSPDEFFLHLGRHFAMDAPLASVDTDQAEKACNELGLKTAWADAIKGQYPYSTIQTDCCAIVACHAICSALENIPPFRRDDSTEILAKVTKRLLMLIVGVVEHKLVWRLARVCGSSSGTFDERAFMMRPQRDVTPLGASRSKETAAQCDLKYRILESLMHENERGRVLDRPELAIALLLGGVSLRGMSAAESNAYFNRAIEMASRLLDRNETSLMIHRRLMRSMDRAANLDVDRDADDLEREREHRQRLIAGATLETLIIQIAGQLRDAGPYDDGVIWRDKLHCFDSADGRVRQRLLQAMVLLCAAVDTDPHSIPSKDVRRSFFELLAATAVWNGFQPIAHPDTYFVSQDIMQRLQNAKLTAVDKRREGDCLLELAVCLAKLHFGSRHDARCFALALVTSMMDRFTCAGLLVARDGTVSPAAVATYLRFATTGQRLSPNLLPGDPTLPSRAEVEAVMTELYDADKSLHQAASAARSALA